MIDLDDVKGWFALAHFASLAALVVAGGYAAWWIAR